MPKREPDLDAVKARINAVGKRHKVRWSISKHTAEMAIAAFASPRMTRVPHVPGAKSRRRKRHKRLL